MPPAALYAGLVAAAVATALLERAVALRHERRLLRQGAREVAPWVLRVMTPVYAAVFPAAVAEHVLGGRRPTMALVVAMLALFLAAKALKMWAVVHLGEAWTMKVILPEHLAPVTGGPYRYVRHPNYVAVMVEVVALPLAGGAYWTALVGGGFFLALLTARVRTEEAALMAQPGYAEAMAARGRFLPRRDAR